MNHRQRIRIELIELERRFGKRLDEIPQPEQRSLLTDRPGSRSIFDRCGARNVRFELLRSLANGNTPSPVKPQKRTLETTTAHAGNAGTLF